MDVCEWLGQIRKLDELINAKIAERDHLMDLATKCTGSLDGMPHGGGVSDKVGNIAVKLVTLAEYTNQLIDQYIDHKDKVVAALETLPPKEYGVLHRHYVQYMTLEAIAEDMGYSVMQVWRYKKRGLQMLENRVMECYLEK
jgi:RNA polymerase sigma factor (sigma-70 family)